MKISFLILFLHAASYAISVSQLEQLYIARKNIAIALNQYSDVIHMKLNEIRAWKKKIETNFAVIQRFDPQEALKLKETMIDPTFAALEKIQKQKSVLKNSDMKMSSDSQIKQSEKKVDQPQLMTKVSLDNTETISTVQTEQKIDFVPEQEIILKPTESKKVIAVLPVKVKKDQSAHEGVVKEIGEPESKKIMDISETEVIKQIELPLVEKEVKPKKVIPALPAKVKKDQSPEDIKSASKKIDEPQVNKTKEPVGEIELQKPAEPSLIEKEAVQEQETTSSESSEKKTQKNLKNLPINTSKPREKVSSQRKTQVHVGKKVIQRKTELSKPNEITSAKEDINQKDKEVQSDVNAIQPEPVTADVPQDEIKPIPPNVDNVSDTTDDFFMDINNV